MSTKLIQQKDGPWRDKDAFSFLKNTDTVIIHYNLHNGLNYNQILLIHCNYCNF